MMSPRTTQLPIAVFVALCAAFSAAPAAGQQGTRPELVIADKTYSFGKVTAGDIVKHDFVVENRGAGVLRISRIRSTCDCTTATMVTKALPPRTTALLHVELDTTDRVGPQLKTIYLSTNDLSQPVVACTLRGTVSEKPTDVQVREPPQQTGETTPDTTGTEGAGTPVTIAPAPIDVGPPKAAPAIAVPNAVHDFGRVTRGKLIEHEFLVRNTGNADLTILRVSTSCGCTSASALPTVIESGKEGRVRVKFDTKGRSGEQRKTVTIHSDDPTTPDMVCVIKGQVVVEVDIEPTLLQFGTVNAGTAVRKTFTVTRFENTPLTISELKSTLEHVQARIVSVSREQNSAEVEVTITDDAPLGKINSSVFIVTGHAMDYSQRVRITADVVGDIDVTPRSLQMFLRKGANNPGVLRLRKTGNTPLAITGAKCAKGLFILSIAVIRPGEEYEIYVTPHLVGSAGNFVRDNITIETNSTMQPVITVPIMARLQ